LPEGTPNIQQKTRGAPRVFAIGTTIIG